MTQGQDGTSNAFPAGAFSLDYGQNGINLQQDHQNNVSHRHPIMGWMGGQSSSNAPVQFQDLLADDGLLHNNWVDPSTCTLNNQNSVPFQELLAPNDLLPSSDTGVVIDQSFASEPMAAHLGLGNGRLVNRPLSLQRASSSSSALPQNIDLNAACDSCGTVAYLDNDTGLSLNPFKPAGRPDGDQIQNPFGINSSNSDPLVISSGIAGYVVEENDNQEGLSSDGRRLSCKRRAPEDGSRSLTLGESSRSSQLTHVTAQEIAARMLNSSNPANNVQYSEQPGTGFVVGLEAAPVVHQPAESDPRSGLVESSQRNIRMRRSVTHQDFASANLAALAARSSYAAQLPGRQPILLPFGYCSNTSTPTPQFVNTPPNSLEALQRAQWNAVTRSRTGLPYTAYTLNGGDAFRLEDHPSPNASTGMLPPPGNQRRNQLEQFSTNLNFVPAGNNNIAASSRNSVTTCTHPSLVPIWFSRGSMARQNAQRISSLVNRAEPQGQGSSRPLHWGVSLASRERGGHTRASQIPFRSGLIVGAERQADTYPEITFNSLTLAQRRSRVVSEVRNALALVRRGGSLQIEDVMVIDRSVLYGVPEEPDIHEDMRLDVENMSYEELLALEDQIGNVSTGLSESTIQSHMKRNKYRALEVGPAQKEEPCCICQEEYADGQDIGKLDCGHDFHFNCIKQWLVQKNSCPICKMTALKV